MNAQGVWATAMALASYFLGYWLGHGAGSKSGVARERARWVRFTAKLAPHVGRSIEDLFGRGGGGR